MSNSETPKDVHIQSEPAAGAEPAHVSVIIDGDKKYVVRTSDLENIGAQLRGKKPFSFFYSIVVPALAVFVSTGIAQTFQYISWRNDTQLKQATERAEAAKKAYVQSSKAISERYYATLLYLNATLALNKKSGLDDTLHNVDLKFNQKSFDDYNDQMKSWSDSYDQILSDIDFYMDRPVLWNAQRTTVADFTRFDCSDKSTLLSEMQRLGLNINSLKVQFAAISYCFHQAMLPFDIEMRKALNGNAYYPIPPTEKLAAAKRIESVRSMSNEFRCFAQHRIALFNEEKRKAIFKLSRWISDRIASHFVNSAKAARAVMKKQLEKAIDECDFTKKAQNTDRFAS
jgi:hypothetical protein